MDYTFTILSRDKVDSFLQHLDSQQSTIRLTLEAEAENTIPFVDIGQYRLGRVAVYQCLQEPTHTDQYLAYDFHHPIFVKRVIVKCLYDRSKQLSETNNDFWRKETCHQSLVRMVLRFLL